MRRLRTRANDAAFDAESGALRSVSFGIDHPHARGRDDDVIDVRTGAREAAIVEHPSGLWEVLEPGGEHLFSDGAALPRTSALRLIRQSQDETAELRVLPADTPLTVVAAAFRTRAVPRRRRRPHGGQHVGGLVGQRGLLDLIERDAPRGSARPKGP